MRTAAFHLPPSVRRGGAVQQTELTIGAEDRVVMLSTCVKGDHSKRFVVLARLVPYGDYVFA